MTSQCVFCDIVNGSQPASIVFEDEFTLAFMDIRQFHAGHVLVIPRQHFNDVRELDRETGAALMHTVSRLTRAVGLAFPNDGLSLWHSIGPAAFQEVPHLHIHIHPRLPDDNFLRVYPGNPPGSDQATRDQYAELVRARLDL
ncbi:MAG: HIT domain-containing protein [Acidobacteria bacterium]|nr:HIT domain-containing protein [Acidobacteriota bacterium]